MNQASGTSDRVLELIRPVSFRPMLEQGKYTKHDGQKYQQNFKSQFVVDIIG